jgi:hypothetical protein
MGKGYKEEVMQLARDYQIAKADAQNEYNKAVNDIEKTTAILPDAAADFYLGNVAAEEVAKLVIYMKDRSVERDVAALAVQRIDVLMRELAKEYEEYGKS